MQNTPAAAKAYKGTLEKTKKQHWLDWLERAEDPDIWSVHQVTSSAPSDGGKARIPPLQYTTEDGTHMAATNERKEQSPSQKFLPAQATLAVRTNPGRPETSTLAAEPRQNQCGASQKAAG
jgi:hypothetical protein